MNLYRIISRYIMLASLFMIVFPAQASAVHNEASSSAVRIIVKSSSHAAYATEIRIRSASLRKELAQAPADWTPPPALVTEAYIQFPVKKKMHEYEYAAGGIIFNRSHNQTIKLSKKFLKLLEAEIAKLKQVHYGQLLSWEEINRRMPKLTRVSIVDLETGLSFRVQRRAGRDHADVQPLSKRDSAIMKKIYNDQWSWNRRAILIRHEDQVWAGSMNGMPHGGDGIPDNGFKGHFCIHFSGSLTHKRHQTDLAHQAMTYKAAGKLLQFVEGLAPEQMAELWAIAFNHQDETLLQALSGPAALEWKNQAQNLTALAPIKQDDRHPIAQRPSFPLTAEVPLKAVYSGKQHDVIGLTFTRTSPADRWVVHNIKDKKVKNSIHNE